MNHAAVLNTHGTISDGFAELHLLYTVVLCQLLQQFIACLYYSRKFYRPFINRFPVDYDHW